MANPETGDIYELALDAIPVAGDITISSQMADMLKKLEQAQRTDVIHHLSEQRGEDEEKRITARPSLILCIGLPKSGKSTWAKEQNVPIVNPDSIRLALHGSRYRQEAEPYVWAIAHTMVHALFLAGHPVVIVDATNNTRKRRDAWKCEAWDLLYKQFNITVEECISRAQKEGDREIIPTIKRMAEQHEPLGDDEPSI